MSYATGSADVPANPGQRRNGRSTAPSRGPEIVGPSGVATQSVTPVTDLPAAFHARAERTPVRDACDELRQALTPIDALLALHAMGAVDEDAIADAQEGLRRVLAAVERLERGEGGTP